MPAWNRGSASVVASVVALACGIAVAAPPTPAGDPVPKPANTTGRPVAPVVKPQLVFTVDVRWLNSSPYRIEREITTRIEQALKTLPGVVSIRSTVLSSRAQTIISFDPKGDASSIASSIRSRLDQIKTRLPREASSPLIAWHRDPPL